MSERRHSDATPKDAESAPLMATPDERDASDIMKERVVDADGYAAIFAADESFCLTPFTPCTYVCLCRHCLLGLPTIYAVNTRA